jgi:hypothetical protein
MFWLGAIVGVVVVVAVFLACYIDAAAKVRW